MKNSLKLTLVSAIALAAMTATPAFATGTAAGSTITNNVTVNFQVGGVAQTATSASNTLTVDRKVNLTVAEVGSSTTTVSPGQLAAVTTFTLTNTSNATLDFALSATQIATGAAGAHSNTDAFDVSNVKIYVDSNGDGVFNAGDTLVTYLDEIAQDTSKTVFIVSDVPLTPVTNDVAAVILTATGREGGGAAVQGAALIETTGANTAGMDTVFGDAAGASDAARDAAFSAKDDYTVKAAALSVVKSSTIISDPVNGSTNPKFIPGATLQYCIAVTNASGGADATTVALSDTLPSTVTYDSAYGIKMNGTVTGGVCATDGTAGGSYTAGPPNIVAGSFATVAAGSSKTLLFRATIN